MTRRDFIKVIAGSAAAWPLAVRAQQPERMRQIAFLMNTNEADGETQRRLSALRKGLSELGWIEGKNIRIETRWGGGSPERVRTMPENSCSRHRMFL